MKASYWYFEVLWYNLGIPCFLLLCLYMLKQKCCIEEMCSEGWWYSYYLMYQKSKTRWLNSTVYILKCANVLVQANTPQECNHAFMYHTWNIDYRTFSFTVTVVVLCQSLIGNHLYMIWRISGYKKMKIVFVDLLHTF